MVSGSKVNASMDATSIITQVSRDDEQLNVYPGEKGKTRDYTQFTMYMMERAAIFVGTGSLRLLVGF